MHRFPFFFILICGVAITYWEYLLYVLAIITLIVLFRIFKALYRWIRSIQMNCRLEYVDNMDGLAFEVYIATVLKNQGYTNVQLTEQYDYGVDIIAIKNGIRWGIQVKRYSGLVKADAVRQVVAGLNIYGCDRAMVITNSVYSKVAVRLADSNGCVLVDRTGLARMGINLKQMI